MALTLNVGAIFAQDMCLLNIAGIWCFVFTPDVRCVVTLHAWGINAGDYQSSKVPSFWYTKTFEQDSYIGFYLLVLQYSLTKSTYLTGHTYADDYVYLILYTLSRLQAYFIHGQ